MKCRYIVTFGLVWTRTMNQAIFYSFHHHQRIVSYRTRFTLLIYKWTGFYAIGIFVCVCVGVCVVVPKSQSQKKKQKWYKIQKKEEIINLRQKSLKVITNRSFQLVLSGVDVQFYFSHWSNDCGIWFEQDKSIDSLLNFCCTCVCLIGPVFDVLYCICFDVSLIWTVFISDVCGIVAITVCAVILVWDCMLRDFNNGGFLIDAENANPRRNIALN